MHQYWVWDGETHLRWASAGWIEVEDVWWCPVVVAVVAVVAVVFELYYPACDAVVVGAFELYCPACDAGVVNVSG